MPLLLLTLALFSCCVCYSSMYFLNVFIVAILKLYTDIVIQFFFYLQILPLQTFSKKKKKKGTVRTKRSIFFSDIHLRQAVLKKKGKIKFTWLHHLYLSF